MRWPNDRRLAREVPEINLILGGHDHDYQWEMVSQSPNKIHPRAVPCVHCVYKQYSPALLIP